MPINITSFSNYTGDPVTGLMGAINTESQGVFGIMLLFGVYILTFVTATRYGTKTAFTTSAFIGVIMAIILRLLSLISDKVLYGCFAMVVVAVLVLWFSRDA
jgi:hypothetical protein